MEAEAEAKQEKSNTQRARGTRHEADDDDELTRRWRRDSEEVYFEPEAAPARRELERVALLLLLLAEGPAAGATCDANPRRSLATPCSSSFSATTRAFFRA